MPIDKSLFFYGKPFHIFIDSLTRPHREEIIALVPEGAYILDAGCGNGELSLALRERKGCRVVGVDLSVRMIDFAKSRNPHSELKFLHRDATQIDDFADGHFDIVVLCQVMHELPAQIRSGILAELMRLGGKVLILDYNAPLPDNSSAFISRLIETTIGRDHYSNFKSYPAAGGLMGILKQAGLASHIEQRHEDNRGCSQVVELNCT